MVAESSKPLSFAQSPFMNVTEILHHLISFPVLGGQVNGSIASWIEKYLIQHGVAFVNVWNEEKTKRCIHCRIGPAIDGGVILSGHMDVVPVDGQDWTYPPFELTDPGDGKLYGRGTSDMKGYVACCLSLVPEMMVADLKRPIYLALSFDEEIGCRSGQMLANHMRDYYEEKPAFAIIGEPTMLHGFNCQKGIVVYKTSLNGINAHSSKIMEKVSAIHESARLITWLEDKMHELIGNGHIDHRFVPPHTTFHVGTFEKSGIQFNIVSDSASFMWEIRNIPMDSIAGLFGEFEAFCREREVICQQRFPDFRIVNEEIHDEVPSLDTPEESRVVELIRTITGNHAIKSAAYAAEAGQFQRAGFEAIICGPGDIDQAHKADEFISKDQLQKGVEMIKKLIEISC